MKVNILGTKYKIIFDDAKDQELKGKNRQGYCFFDAREIHIADLNTDEEWKKENPQVRKRRTGIILRHEIIHAFLNESGLCQNTIDTDAWAINEEMVDWIAMQFPKMLKAFKEVGAL